MTEMKALIPGFQVDFNPEMSLQESRDAQKYGIQIVGDMSYWIADPILKGTLSRWMIYPLPLILMDRCYIDKSALEKLVDIRRGWDLGREVIRLLYNSGEVFELYSAQKILDSYKTEFKQCMFSIGLDEVSSRAIRQFVAKPREEYDEMIVEPWMFEVFRISTTLFAQACLSKDETAIPLVTRKNGDERCFSSLIRHKYSAEVAQAFFRNNKESIDDFCEGLSRLSEKLHLSPFSKKGLGAEDIANTIVGLKEDEETVHDVREHLFKIYKATKTLNKFEEEVTQAIESRSRIRREFPLRTALSFLTTSIPTIAWGIWEWAMLILPGVLTLVDAKREYGTLKSLNWVGFFDRLKPQKRWPWRRRT